MNRNHRSNLWQVAALAIGATLLAPAAQAQATIPVNSTAQEVTLATPNGVVNGNCTLGEAILAANTNATVDACVAGQSGGTDTIMIPAGTYTLTDVAKNPAPFNIPVGLPDISEAVILQGAGATATILERSPAAATPAFAMTAAFGGSVVFESLTIRNFFTTCGQGGAAVMRFTVPVTLNNGIVEDNLSDANCGGGLGAFAEMFNASAPFSATNTLFRNNISNHATGTVVYASGPVTLTNSSFLNNHNDTSNAGGVLHLGGDGPLSISNSVFVGNNAAGGGVMVLTGLPNCGPSCGLNPVVNISRSVFLNNSTDCCGSGGFVGGVMESSGQNITLTIVDSTFAGNTADNRGGVFSLDNTGTVTIRNSTFSGNLSNGAGAAIFAHGGVALNLSNVTFLDNSSLFGQGSIFLQNTATAALRNSIVALSLNSGACSLVSQGGQPLFASQGHNVFDHTTCAVFSATDATDQIGTQAAPLNPLVQALADNGSTVMAGANIPGVISPQVIQTMGLLTGSPALNMGDPGVPGSASPACEATDQRGIARPQPMGGVCDVGAFEDLTGAGVPANFDLSVTKSDAPDPVVVNNNLTWTIVISNAGPDIAPAVTLTDSLPAGATFVSATPSNAPAGTCMQAAGLVTCSLGVMNSGAGVTVDIVVTVTGAAASPLVNTATVSATGNEATPADNTATSSTTVTGLTADLALTKGDAPDPIILGAGNLTYQLVVTNNGPNTANNIVLTDTLPAGVNFVSATPSVGMCVTPPAMGVLTCNLGALANGAMATVSIVVTPTGTGMITNTASVAATETDPVPADNTASAITTVNAQANLDANKTDSADPVTVGSNITYTLNVQNLGPSPATNVMLVDTLPATVNFVSVSAPCAHNAGTVTCSFGNLASGAFTPNITLVVTTTAASAPSVFNHSVAAATEPDPDLTNNNGDETTTVNPSADISVTKSDAPDPVTAASNLTYTITVNNAGPSAAASVTMSDTLPAGTTFVSLTSPAGWTCTTPAVGAAGTVNCSIASLASGVAAQAFTLVVATTAAGNLSNIATVTTTTSDPNAANNSATAATTVSAGTGTDFSISAPSVVNVAAGAMGSVTITLAPIGGAFNTPVMLTGASAFLGPFSFSPNPATIGATSANVTMTFTAGAQAGGFFGSSHKLPYLWVLLAGGILLSSIALLRAPRRLRYAGLALGLVLLAAGSQTACVDGARQLEGPVPVTVTATAGNISHSVTITVNVTR